MLCNTTCVAPEACSVGPQWPCCKLQIAVKQSRCVRAELLAVAVLQALKGSRRWNSPPTAAVIPLVPCRAGNRTSSGHRWWLWLSACLLSSSPSPSSSPLPPPPRPCHPHRRRALLRHPSPSPLILTRHPPSHSTRHRESTSCNHRWPHRNAHI